MPTQQSSENDTPTVPLRQCPPHYWIIDSDNQGRCRYCPETRDFQKLLRGTKTDGRNDWLYPNRRLPPRPKDI